MRSPALAIAWEFRQRHRWGLIALAGYLLVLGTIKLLILEPGSPVELNDPETFAATVIVPVATTFMYFLAVFSFGLAGDLAARQSIYPARMFTLPVTTAALAGWPMLYGTAAVAMLWLATRLLALWPPGIDVPLIWPVLLAFSGLLASTWKQLVQSLYIGLTGREWLIKSIVFLTLSFLVVIGPIAHWIIENSDVRAALWDALPWIPAVLVCLKMSAAAWVAIRLYRSRLLSDRLLVTGAACWLVVVLALYGVLVWLVFTPHIPRHFLGLLAILAVPLARLSAAPLALAWNRHR